jgi:hypothetical protein
VASIILLLVLAAPFLGAHFGLLPDERLARRRRLRSRL